MKRMWCILCILFPIVFIPSCKQITEEITQVNYIVPVWKGSLPSAPNNPEVGWAYYNTTVKKSFIYDGSSWQIMAQDGTDGLGITWKGELSTAPSNPKLNWAYYNTIDGNSYIYNGSSWDLLAKSGRDGASGILLWLGSYSSAPNNPSNGWAYYNTTEGVSYIFDNGNWEILAKDGDSIIWKGALYSAPQNPLINWAYYNINDQTSYIWNGSQWDTLATSLGGDTIVTVGISWLGTFASAPLNPAIGNAYYNSTIGASYIYDGNSWQQISKDGINGTSSTAGYLITWKGSYSSAPSNPKAGWAYYNTSTKKSYIYDGSSWQILAQDGANGSSSGGSSGTNNGLVFINETSETIDGITYKVKSYADVYTPEPYFFTYYKYYYLNNKIRRLHLYYHSVGSDLDYTYLNFVEHECGNNSLYPQIYTYYDNGKLESYTQSTKSNNILYKYTTYYDSNGVKLSYVYYQNDKLYFEYTYYPNGNTKTQKTYDVNATTPCIQSDVTNYENGNKKVELRYQTNVYPSYLYSKDTYYENGKEEWHIYYSAAGVETTKTYTTYYDNKNKKTYTSYYSGGTQIEYYREYYDSSTSIEKTFIEYNSDGTIETERYKYADGTKYLEVDYNTDGTIDNFDYHYSSGYTQYYYTDSGYLYTYQDGKTTSTSTSSSFYSSKVAYTASQASAKLAELKGE